MTRKKKILTGILAVLVLALSVLAFAISHDSPCGSAAAVPEGQPRMRAMLYRCYGAPEVLRLEATAKPVAADDEVLVKVYAASVNPLDWHYMRGEPYVMRLGSGLGAPNDQRMGVDFAGIVEAAGSNVVGFKPGDAVFGGKRGALGQYVAVRAARMVLKPETVSFEQAAAVPIAGVTALQALRDKGLIKAGQKVLINGASGGVGTFAVQIAKAYGAEVTGVCSTRNVELVRSIGADHVIDYTAQDFTTQAQRYDLILDNVGNHSPLALKRVLVPTGRIVIVGGPSDDPWLGPIATMLRARAAGMFMGQEVEGIFADINRDDLAALADWMRQGKVTPVIDRRYPLDQAAAAIAYIETGRARGKVIVTVD